MSPVQNRRICFHPNSLESWWKTRWPIQAVQLSIPVEFPRLEKRGEMPKRTHKQVAFRAIEDLRPNPNNPRKHPKSQISALAKSMREFGFTVPILIDRVGNIIAGAGRYLAARLNGDKDVPVICLDHLTEAQVKAYILADNRLGELSSWDEVKLATQLKELSDLVLDFDIELTGFELPEIDFRVQSLDAPEIADAADEFEEVQGPAVSVAGDLWLLGEHRLYCGNALDTTAYVTTLEDQKATVAITDPPYNVKIDGHVSGKGRVRHREFAMASGEMTEAEFTHFLTVSHTLMCAYTVAGAVHFVFMDWRHMWEVLVAGRSAGCDLLNLCVWAKSNAGMGSFYRSQHELVFVFRNGKQPHRNNIQLGRFGRNRSHVWIHPGTNSFARKGIDDARDLHPTVKPIALVSDAILDSTKRGEIVLDPFLGSGTTLLAAERTGRRCYGIEIDPLYVDTTVERWQ
jgi:ParB-like chromosome segregation protein Spo0J